MNGDLHTTTAWNIYISHCCVVPIRRQQSQIDEWLTQDTKPCWTDCEASARLESGNKELDFIQVT